MNYERSEKEYLANTNKDSWVNQRTGEVIEAITVTKKINRNGFMITYLSSLINLIDTLGNKKMKIVKYILNEMEKSNNTLIITTEELAKKTETSKKTVIDTLKILDKANIIKRRTGAIMVNSDLIHRGTSEKEQALIQKFSIFENEENKKDS